MRCGQLNNRYAFFVKLLLITVIVCIGGCTKKTPTERPKEEVSVKASTENTSANIEKSTSEAKPWRESLDEIIKRKGYWSPILTDWYGKELADFSLNDIDGNMHKLSSYKGKNVIVALWATWCQPCMVEMPNIIALQNIINRDNLPVKILAISNENSFSLRKFTNRQGINYTVISGPSEMLPSPMNLIRNIPTTFFIDPQGKIKLVIEGSASLSELKAIVLAE